MAEEEEMGSERGDRRAAGPPGGEWVVNMKTISKIELKTRCWPPPCRKVKTESHAQCTRTKPILKFWGWRKE